MTCAACISMAPDTWCETPQYSESQTSGWHIRQSDDIHWQTHVMCGLVFPAKTQSAVAPDSGLCSACLGVLHPEIKAVAKAAECWDDD